MNIPINKGWTPDAIPYNAPEGSLLICTNLIPSDEKYENIRAKSVYCSATLTGTPRSTYTGKASNGNYYTIVGTTSDLIRLDTTTTVSIVSKTTASPYTTGENRWYFQQVADKLVCTDFADNIQVLDPFSTDTTAADLTGSPPKAKFMLYYQNHLILAHLASYPTKLQWSGRGDITDWTTSLVTGAGNKDIVEGRGNIKGLARAGNSFLVFHDNSVTVGYYAGGYYTFGFAENKFDNIGCIEGSPITVGNYCYWFDSRDFWRSDGNTCESIGFGVRRTLLNTIAAGTQYLTTSAYDPVKGIIYWAICTSGSIPNIIIAYNPRLNRFSYINMGSYCIMTYAPPAVLLSDLDIYGTLAEVPYSLDSSVWSGGSPTIGCIDSVNAKISGFTGAVEENCIETAEYTDGNINLVKSIRPKYLSAVDNVRVQIGYRMNENDGVAYSNEAIVNQYGKADMLITGRYLRIKICAGEHNGIPMSMDADVVPRAKR